MNFDWYEEIKSNEEITQGDILLKFPFIEINEYEGLFEGNPEDTEIDMDLVYKNCIVLTQPCDLARPKDELKNVILCQIHDIDESGLDKNKLLNIVKGSSPQFYMLNKNDDFIYKNKDLDIHMEGFNYHIVNFDIVEKVPIKAIQQYAKTVENRLRLLPPYREHLSQAFAKYFMRIGLPSDINRKDFDKYNK